MKRSFTKVVLLAVLASFLLTACWGKFALMRKVYTFNESFGNKWVNSVVMWVMIVIPVYEVAGLVDWYVLNTIEFWTGSNPLALKDGQKEEKIVTKDGHRYRLTATKDRMRMETMDAKIPADISLNYKPENKSWYIQDHGRTVKVATVLDQNLVQVFNPDGSSFELNTATGLAEGSIPALAMR